MNASDSGDPSFVDRQPHLELDIEAQPTQTSCGPTCLAAVYRYWNQPVGLTRLIADIGELPSGGTMSVILGCDALRRGFAADLVTYNLQMFDPTWFNAHGEMFSADHLSEKLQRQHDAKCGRTDLDQARLTTATNSYLQYLSLGGQLRMRPLQESWLVVTLAAGVPILCGLSATYLYQEARERAGIRDGAHIVIPDDVGGDPTGHFVVLHGYQTDGQVMFIADPMHPNPMAPTNKYAAPLWRVTSAILLGILTYDANLLMVQPR